MTKSQTNTAGHQEQVEHLALVLALSHEVSTAISAIERNDLPELATRVVAQEAICLKLEHKGTQSLQFAFESYRRTSTSLSEVPELKAIRDAHLALAQLNRIYSGLVQRSQRSIRLIASLYQNHGQRYNKDANAVPGNHTWSCEV